MELSEKIKTIRLLDVYENLLTQKQRETLEGYLVYDITLSELATLHQSSRQAIFDTIQKTTKALFEFEEKLGILEKRAQITSLLDDLDCTDNKTNSICIKIKDLLN